MGSTLHFCRFRRAASQVCRLLGGAWLLVRASSGDPGIQWRRDPDFSISTLLSPRVGGYSRNNVYFFNIDICLHWIHTPSAVYSRLRSSQKSGQVFCGLRPPTTCSQFWGNPWASHVTDFRKELGAPVKRRLIRRISTEWALPLWPTVEMVICSAKTGLWAYKWLFPQMGVALNGWFIVEKPMTSDDLGVPPWLRKPPNTYFLGEPVKDRFWWVAVLRRCISCCTCDPNILRYVQGQALPKRRVHEMVFAGTPRRSTPSAWRRSTLWWSRSHTPWTGSRSQCRRFFSGGRTLVTGKHSEQQNSCSGYPPDYPSIRPSIPPACQRIWELGGTSPYTKWPTTSSNQSLSGRFSPRMACWTRKRSGWWTVDALA